MKKCFIALAMIVFKSFIFIAQAQTTVIALGTSVNSQVSFTVTGTPTLAPFTTDSDIENGIISDGVNFAVKSNRLWKLTISVTNIVGAPIADGPATITAPVQPVNVSWGVINGTGGTVTSWTVFANATTTTTAPIVAKTGTRGTPAVSGNTFTLRYKMIPGFAVDPGTYAVDVTYSVDAL